MLRFSAHLGYLFLEYPLRARPAAASRAGFAAIEHPSPYEIAAAELRHLLGEQGLSFVQLALPAGDAAKAEKGFAAWPGREREFRDSLQIGLEYAAASGARFIQVQSGTNPIGYGQERVRDTYLTNLLRACEGAAAAGREVLIEPIGPATLKDYFMCETPLALDAIRTLRCPNLKMLYDLFHGRCAGEDPAAVIREHADIIGHIQIADFPGRHEPGTGGTDFERVFAALADCEWDGFVGCEYQPSATTESGLRWLEEAMARDRAGRYHAL